MTLQTSATPINGREAAEMIKRQVTHLIENTPGLDEASAYHRVTIVGNFKLKAYPADVPCPAKEIEFDVNSVSTTKKENEEVFLYVQRMETVREELIHRLQEVTDILDEVNPEVQVEFNLNAGTKPDELRIEQGLPIPVTEKVDGRTIEKYVPVVKNKATGNFQFATGRNNK